MQQGGLAANAVSMLGPVWSALSKSRSSSFGNRVRQLDRFARGYQLSPADRYWMLCSHATQGNSLNLLHASWKQRVEEAELDQRRKELLKVLEQPGGINRMLLADQRIVLNGDMLRKVDLMSMAHSLEVRVPFLDHRLVNFAATLPESAKIIPGMKKRILQDAFRSILPESLYNRRKMGFEVPLQHWFRGELRDLLEKDLLSEDFVREQGIFDPAGVRALLDKLFGYDPGGVQDRIYALLVFQNWWKKWHQS
jgi:asparagine synthase (glutamine-hydrolysing)